MADRASKAISCQPGVPKPELWNESWSLLDFYKKFWECLSKKMEMIKSV